MGEGVSVLDVGSGHGGHGRGPGAVEQVVLEQLLLLDGVCGLMELCWGIMRGMAPLCLLLCVLGLPRDLHKRRRVFSVLVGLSGDGVARQLRCLDVDVRGVERCLVVAGHRVDRHG